MKLRDLFEKLTAHVHIGADKKLHVISSLVQKSFGPSFDKITGGCLAAQMIYSMSAAADISPSILIAALNKSEITAGLSGTTLDSLYKVFDNKPITVGKEKLTFKLSVETPSIDEAIADVKSGQPVIFIPSRQLQFAFETISQYSYTGIAKLDSSVMKHNVAINQHSFHAYLLIGYDSTKPGFVILRDMRSTYSYKGYLKAPIVELKKNNNAYKLITIVVDDIKREEK